jgi:hypothetical protein
LTTRTAYPGSATVGSTLTAAQVNALPGGWVTKNTLAGPVTLSTTAGTYTDVIVGDLFTPVSANRRFLVRVWSNGNLFISGSAFTTSDTWLMKFQVSVGGGAYADVAPVGWYIARAPVAQAFRYPIPHATNDYEATTAASLQFKAAATKSSGASTVTSALEADFHLLVSDDGPI